MTHPVTVFGLTLDSEGLEAIKEVKLHLPLRTHVRLRAVKLFWRQSIGVTIEAAVRSYFERIHAEPQGAPGERGAQGLEEPL